MSDNIKFQKGDIQEGQTVYAIISPDGKLVTSAIDFHANDEEDVVAFLEKVSLELDRRVNLYVLTKVCASNHINYERYIESDAWRRKAKEAKSRAGHRCQVCYGKDGLDAHHRTYRRLGNEKPEDITVLCRDCHTLFHENGKIKG